MTEHVPERPVDVHLMHRVGVGSRGREARLAHDVAAVAQKTDHQLHGLVIPTARRKHRYAVHGLPAAPRHASQHFAQVGARPVDVLGDESGHLRIVATSQLVNRLCGLGEVRVQDIERRHAVVEADVVRAEDLHELRGQGRHIVHGREHGLRSGCRRFTRLLGGLLPRAFERLEHDHPRSCIGSSPRLGQRRRKTPNRAALNARGGRPGSML